MSGWYKATMQPSPISTVAISLDSCSQTGNVLALQCSNVHRDALDGSHGRSYAPPSQYVQASSYT